MTQPKPRGRSTRSTRQARPRAVTSLLPTRSAAVVLGSVALLGIGGLGSSWGPVYEIETTDLTTGETESTEMVVELPNLKMTVASRAGGAPQEEMIFRGDRRELVVVDHEERSYMVIDEEAVRAMAGQVAAALESVEGMGIPDQVLEQMPENQRRQLEAMLRDRNAGASVAGEAVWGAAVGGAAVGRAGVAPAISPEYRHTGERATHQGYRTTKVEELRAGVVMQELWITPWDELEGGADARIVFEDLAAFMQEITDALGGQLGGEGDDLFGEDNVMRRFMDLDGFPVVTRSFEGGALEEESTLESVTERDLDPDAFEPPKGYRLRSMGPG